jgi:hypothetical protein
MPATRNIQTGASGPPGAAGSPDSGQRHLGRSRRLRSGAAPHGPPDMGVLAREAVISFLQDASKATAEREAVRAGAAATGTEATITAAAGNTAGNGASEADWIAAVAREPEAMPRDAISAASPVAARSEAWRLAAISAAALDRIEAAAAKVEADIAVAHRAYGELQAGAGAAAEAAVRAAESAMASAGTAVEAERQVRISLRQVRQNVVITVVLVAIMIIVLTVATTTVH